MIVEMDNPKVCPYMQVDGISRRNLHMTVQLIRLFHFFIFYALHFNIYIFTPFYLHLLAFHLDSCGLSSPFPTITILARCFCNHWNIDIAALDMPKCQLLIC